MVLKLIVKYQVVIDLFKYLGSLKFKEILMNKLTKLSIIGITIASFLGANIAYSFPQQKGPHQHKAAPAGKGPTKKAGKEDGAIGAQMEGVTIFHE